MSLMKKAARAAGRKVLSDLGLAGESGSDRKARGLTRVRTCRGCRGTGRVGVGLKHATCSGTGVIES